MRVLRPGQKVTLHESDDPTQSVEGIIRCVTVFDDLSVQYECRWWNEREQEIATFSGSEIEEHDDAKYIEINECEA